MGHLSCSVAGYEPCHDAEKVMEETGYRVDEDTENTADSVFCSHGAGYLVPWDQVDDHCAYSILDRSVLPDQNKTMGRPEENSRSIGVEDFAGMPEAPLQKRTQGSYRTACHRRRAGISRNQVGGDPEGISGGGRV